MASRSPLPPDGWSKFQDRWPVIARVVGVAGGFLDFAYAAASGKGLDAAWLSWCAGLLLAPNIFGRPGATPPADPPAADPGEPGA